MDNNIQLPGRDVRPVSELYGKTLTTLSPVYDPLYRTEGSGTAMGKVTFNENTDIELKTLPRGTYAYEFIITDVFGGETTTLYVPFTWDGVKAKFNVEDANIMREMLYLFGLSI